MQKTYWAIPFILVLGQIFYYTVSGWTQLNGIKIFGYILGLLVTVYFLFIVITEKYIDFRDNFKIKRIRIDTDSSYLDNNLVK